MHANDDGMRQIHQHIANVKQCRQQVKALVQQYGWQLVIGGVAGSLTEYMQDDGGSENDDDFRWSLWELLAKAESLAGELFDE